MENRLTDADMAALVGCTVFAIRKLRLRQGRPSLDRAWALHKATGGAVTLADWQYEPTNRAYEETRWREEAKARAKAMRALRKAEREKAAEKAQAAA
jgi:hypothetical protein